MHNIAHPSIENLVGPIPWRRPNHLGDTPYIWMRGMSHNIVPVIASPQNSTK
jgi:hypothetical protein